MRTESSLVLAGEVAVCGSELEVLVQKVCLLVKVWLVCIPC